MVDIRTQYIKSADMYLLNSLSLTDKKKYSDIKKQILILEKELDEYYQLYKDEKLKCKIEVHDEAKKNNPNFSSKELKKYSNFLTNCKYEFDKEKHQNNILEDL